MHTLDRRPRKRPETPGPVRFCRNEHPGCNIPVGCLGTGALPGDFYIQCSCLTSIRAPNQQHNIGFGTRARSPAMEGPFGFLGMKEKRSKSKSDVPSPKLRTRSWALFGFVDKRSGVSMGDWPRNNPKTMCIFRVKNGWEP